MRFAEDGRKYARELYRISLFVMTETSTFTDLAQQIQTWAADLGFAQVGISNTDLRVQREPLQEWLAKGYHGEMGWLADNLDKRLRGARDLRAHELPPRGYAADSRIERRRQSLRFALCAGTGLSQIDAQKAGIVGGENPLGSGALNAGESTPLC